jgi:hypothetical protein
MQDSRTILKNGPVTIKMMINREIIKKTIFNFIKIKRIRNRSGKMINILLSLMQLIRIQIQQPCLWKLVILRRLSHIKQIKLTHIFQTKHHIQKKIRLILTTNKA